MTRHGSRSSCCCLHVSYALLQGNKVLSKSHPTVSIDSGAGMQVRNLALHCGHQVLACALHHRLVLMQSLPLMLCKGVSNLLLSHN